MRLKDNKKSVLKNALLSRQEKRIKTAYLLSSRFFCALFNYVVSIRIISNCHQTQPPPFSYRVGFMDNNGLAGFDVTEVTEAVR
jgi:hypothetical protein